MGSATAGAPRFSLSVCEACTNDAQCQSGARCIEMDYQSSPHGYYCLAEYPPNCDRPYSVLIHKASLSGTPPADYCGIEESLSTCEAVLALLGDWRCTGTDGMCSATDGGTEVPVPGAVCRQVGGLGDRCTYGCGSTQECLQSGPASTCGQNGNHVPPGWCGG